MKLGIHACAKVCAAVFVVIAFSSVTGVAQQLNFSIDGGNSFGNSFHVAQGSSTNVGVYLSEIPPDNILSSEGLFGFGLQADLDTPSLGSISSATINPIFDFVTEDNFNTVAIEWEAAVLANAVPVSSSVLLGNFEFGSTGAGVSSFTFGDNRTGADASNTNWLAGDGTELDQLVFGSDMTDTYSLTLRTAAIPEPSVFSLLVLSSLSSVRRRRKRAVR